MLVTSVAVLAGMVDATTAAAAVQFAQQAPSVPATPSIPVTPVASHYRKSPAMPATQPAKPSWPAGSADVSLPASTNPTGSAQSHATATPVQAGALPIWLGPADATHTAATAVSPAKARVTVATPQQTSATGVRGALVAVQRTDGATATGSVHLTLGYGVFAEAFGGDWSSRLRLVTLPACALTTPSVPACRIETPVTFNRNSKDKTLSADVTLPGNPSAATNSSAAPLVVAADSSSGGGGGDYSATSLKPSGSWSAGGPADAFTWSYPITVPAVPGGLAPNVALTYNSQAVDGLTPSTNNQPSWLGDGWDYSPGFIERSYASCHQNPAGATQTWDFCWSANNNLTMSLDGQTTTLVPDDNSPNTYHPQNDANERVQYVTDTTDPSTNGAQNSEHWVITTPDGTQYDFGLNELPGWAPGNQATNSVWTEPVFATSAGQPCYNATFAGSSCEQAYRWNLDYVVDTHSDAVAYFYNTESNFYASHLDTTANASYIRGGYLSEIRYGLRANAVYTQTPAAEVEFTTTGRCDQTDQTTCHPSDLSSSTASNWPDVPYDLNCASNAACTVQSPTFWSEYDLQSIQTNVLVGSTETPVDSWKLNYQFPDTGDATTRSLWLSSITRTGQDTTAGGSSAAIAMPSIQFAGKLLSNRVNTTDGYPPITRERMSTITTETGETITVDYSAPGCTSGTPSLPEQNTTLCYPDYWTPTGYSSPIRDWFNKYIVTGVTETDATAGSNDTIQTTYTPVGTPAWHYTEDPTVQADQRTWDQWRGYSGMIVTTGSGDDTPTKTQYSYFRGMNGDTLPNNGVRAATLTDTRGDPPVTDAEQFTGATYEIVVYNGSAVVTDTISDPWSSAATATHAISGLPAQQAFLTGTADTKVYTPLAGGATQETEVDYTHDNYGRVIKSNDQGDVSSSTDDLCTSATYDDNTAAWILDKPADVTTVSVNCSTSPSLPVNAVSDVQTFYDGATSTTAPPTVGDATMTTKATSYTGSKPNYTRQSTTTVDEYGRPTSVLDTDSRTTQTTYTPATGAEPTQQTVTDPLGHVTKTAFDPLRDLTTSVTDPGGYITTEQYDALGRLTAVFKPGETAGTNPPNLKYTYTVSNSGPSVVDTYTLNDDLTYRLSETLYDSMLRARETQTQNLDNSREITDTVYNSNGQLAAVTAPYHNGSAVAPTYVQAISSKVPSETGYTYDGAGRKTAEIADAYAKQTWETTYTYGGNFVTTVPPAGATPETTITNARGETTDLYQYHTGVTPDPLNAPPSGYSDTKYTYYPSGQQKSTMDPAGNTWNYSYDFLGNRVSVADPDTGTTTNTYDNAGQLITTTDSRNKTTTYQYDNDGRRTGAFDTTGNAAPATGNKIAAWGYDSPVVGYPSFSTSYSGGDTYTSKITSYNTLGKPAAVKVTLTGEGTTLIPSTGFITGYTYTPSGNLSFENDPASGGLGSESLNYGYDEFGDPVSLKSSGQIIGSYVTSIGYTELGQPQVYTMPATGGDVWVKLGYDPQTQALNDVQTTDQPSGASTSQIVDDTSYQYANSTMSQGAGLLVSSTDQQNAGAVTDTQCYQYDYADRLSQAWSATDNCAATPATGNAGTVGGPSPYWQSWTYDAAGDRLAATDHDTTGNSANDTTTSYNYPPTSATPYQPHTLSNTTATGPSAAADTASYAYDTAGNTTSITGGSTGNQTLAWNDQDQLATDVTSSGTTSFVYDASGNLLVRRDPNQTTFYFGDEQIVLNPSAETVTATRYYSIGGATIAARQSGGGNPQYLIPDRQGTDQLSIDSNTYAVTRRAYLPFGQTRGAAPTTWPGDLGYVGGTPDPSTSLENLGAREYNPATGRFLSADPVLEQTDPTQLGGYDYAGNDPVTHSDPTGLAMCETSGCEGCQSAVCRSPGNPPLGGTWSTGNPSPGGSSGGGAVNSPPTGGGCNRACMERPDSADDDPGSAPVTRHFDWGDFLIGLGIGVGAVGLGVCVFFSAGSCLIPIAAAATEGAAFGGGAALLSGGIAAAGEGAGAAGVGGGLAALLGVADKTGDDDNVPTVSGDPGGTPTPRGGGDDTPTGTGDAGGANPTPPATSTPAPVEDAGPAAKPAPSCNSFTGTTQVLMGDGTAKPIDQVRVGDTVRNAVPDSATVQQHTVTAAHITYDDRAFDDLTINTPDGPRTITTTQHHLFWDGSLHTWREADNLRPGDQLDTPDGHATLLASHLYTATIVTYNLTIDNIHTYYVEAGTTPVLVHNCGSGPANLYHYTTEENMNKILDSKELHPSLRANNPKDARYGDGQYLTDIAPGTRTQGQLSAAFLRVPWAGSKFTHYIEINVTGLDVQLGRPGVYVIPNDSNLDLTGRILDWGAN